MDCIFFPYLPSPSPVRHTPLKPPVSPPLSTLLVRQAFAVCPDNNDRNLAATTVSIFPEQILGGIPPTNPSRLPPPSQQTLQIPRPLSWFVQEQQGEMELERGLPGSSSQLSCEPARVGELVHHSWNMAGISWQNLEGLQKKIQTKQTTPMAQYTRSRPNQAILVHFNPDRNIVILPQPSRKASQYCTKVNKLYCTVCRR